MVAMNTSLPIGKLGVLTPTVASQTRPDNNIRRDNWGGIARLENSDLMVSGFFAFSRYNIGHMHTKGSARVSAPPH